MRIFIRFVLFLCFLLKPEESFSDIDIMQEASDNQPVVVIGSANEGNHQRKTVVLEQNGEENPLGNPIVPLSLESGNVSEMPQVEKPISPQVNSNPVISETLPQNPKISAQETPQIVNKQIQNTLYEAGGRIYDIQSYPVQDVNYIGEKNINPTITTYPAY